MQLGCSSHGLLAPKRQQLDCNRQVLPSRRLEALMMQTKAQWVVPCLHYSDESGPLGALGPTLKVTISSVTTLVIAAQASQTCYDKVLHDIDAKKRSTGDKIKVPTEPLVVLLVVLLTRLLVLVLLVTADRSQAIQFDKITLEQNASTVEVISVGFSSSSMPVCCIHALLLVDQKKEEIRTELARRKSADSLAVSADPRPSRQLRKILKATNIDVNQDQFCVDHLATTVGAGSVLALNAALARRQLLDLVKTITEAVSVARVSAGIDDYSSGGHQMSQYVQKLHAATLLLQTEPPYPKPSICRSPAEIFDAFLALLAQIQLAVQSMAETSITSTFRSFNWEREYIIGQNITWDHNKPTYRLSVLEELRMPGHGSDPTQFGTSGPGGIAFCPRGDMFISDESNHRVQVFRPSVNSRDYGLVHCFGMNGTSTSMTSNQFRFPSGIAISTTSEVFVGDVLNYRVQVFTTEGVFLRRWGQRGVGTVEFEKISALAIYDNMLFVCDSGNRRIQTFDLQGNFLHLLGIDNFAVSAMTSPVGIAVSPAGECYILDVGTQQGEYLRVMVIDCTSGQFLRQWSVSKYSHSHPYHFCCNKHFIAVSGNNEVFVGDCVFFDDGTLIRRQPLNVLSHWQPARHVRASGMAFNYSTGDAFILLASSESSGVMVQPRSRY